MQCDSDSLRRPMLISSFKPRKRAGGRREEKKKIRMRNPSWVSRFLGVKEKNRMRRFAPVRSFKQDKMKQVKIGVGFGLWRLGMPPAETIVHLADRAEAWGHDSFWWSDRLLSLSPCIVMCALLT